MSMTSSRPYLIRALYEWILDNECTPHVLVNASHDEVEVPRQFVKDGQIVLNVAPSAVQDLNLSNDSLSFNARFAGEPHYVYVPVGAVLGIYARENSQGMVFETEVAADSGEPSATRGQQGEGDNDVREGARDEAQSPSRPKRSASRKPSLRVVK